MPDPIETFALPWTVTPDVPPQLLGPPLRDGDLGSIAKYRIVELLGQGGMGYVFRGEDDSLGRAVALKVMKPDQGGHPDAKARFIREARAAAGLKSDHVIVIHAVGGDGPGEVPYLVMEFLAGRTLADWLAARGGRADALTTCRVARHALRGLAAAHAKGLIHRDVKPTNLWVEEPSGRVKLLDFGIVRDAGDNKLTSTGQILGSAAYMSLEQARGKAVDGRTDLYSLGVVLYQMLTGRNPFDKGTYNESLFAIVEDNPPPADEVVPDVPADLAALVNRMMCKSPGGRPADAAAALEELTAIEAGLRSLSDSADDRPSGGVNLTKLPRPGGSGVKTPPPTRRALETLIDQPGVELPPDPPPPPAKRKRKTAAVLLGIAAAIGLGVAGFLFTQPGGDSSVVAVPSRPEVTPPTKIDPPPPTKLDPPATKSEPPPTRPAAPTTAKANVPIPDPDPLLEVNPRTPTTRPSLPTKPSLPPDWERKAGDEAAFEIAPGVSAWFCWVPAGKAELGSPTTEKGRLFNETIHEFTTTGFWLGKYEVTQAEWAAASGGGNPSHFAGNRTGKAKGLDTKRFPVDSVSWAEAVEFCNRASTHAGKTPRYRKGANGVWAVAEGATGFRLPSEDEWEYACRGGEGNKKPFYFGDVLKGDKANCDGNFPYPTKKGDSGPFLERSAEAGAYSSVARHPWGLCDLLGNVAEWCEDKGNDDRRPIRGGSWYDGATDCRAAHRVMLNPDTRTNRVGFRLCLPAK